MPPLDRHLQCAGCGPEAGEGLCDCVPVDLGDCAYYLGVGSCSYSCYDEPACMTSPPPGGWPPIGRPPYEEMLLTSLRLQVATERWIVWQHVMALLGRKP